jgi:Icc-related predicted phosphoesterase
MDKVKILFASDIHGNKIQYDKLFNHASKNKFDLLILGGDLTPKDYSNRSPEKQGKFLEEYLLKKIFYFKKENNTRILIILGNDDFRSNKEILKTNQKEGYEYIENKSVVYEEIKIVGYSYVPLTPFKYKDWEKLDLNKKIEDRGDAVLEFFIFYVR